MLQTFDSEKSKQAILEKQIESLENDGLILKYDYASAVDFLYSLNLEQQTILSLHCYTTFDTFQRIPELDVDNSMLWDNEECWQIVKDKVVFESVGFVDIYEFTLINQKAVTTNNV